MSTKRIITIIVCLIVIAAGTFTLVYPDALIRYKEDTDYQYIEENGSLTLIKYNGEYENIIVPSEIDGKPVKALKGAFCNNQGVKNVKVSDGIETIDYMSFYGCGALVKVKLPDSVKTIGHAAFLGCMSLDSIDIGSSVKEIMPYAFSDCRFLTDIKLPDGLLFIGENAFSRCLRLKKLTIPASVEVIGGVTLEKGEEEYDQRGNTQNSSFDGCDALRLKISENNPWYALENGKIIKKEK